MAGRLVDRILNIGVSAAAVPVLYGALQKILHSPSADLWLKIGLLTEAVQFLLRMHYYMWFLHHQRLQYLLRLK